MIARPHAVRIGDALDAWEGAYPVGRGSRCEVGAAGMGALGDTPTPPKRVISQMPAAPPSTAATMMYGSSNTVSGHSVPWLRAAGLNAPRSHANLAQTPQSSWPVACSVGTSRHYLIRSRSAGVRALEGLKRVKGSSPSQGVPGRFSGSSQPRGTSWPLGQTNRRYSTDVGRQLAAGQPVAQGASLTSGPTSTLTHM